MAVNSKQSNLIESMYFDECTIFFVCEISCIIHILGVQETEILLYPH